MRTHFDVDSTASPSEGTDSEDLVIRHLLDRTLTYSRRRDYTGWDYGDGMSSRILRALPVESKWLNIAFQEAVKRPPVNLRPFLLVEQRRNYKGTALFALANRNAHLLAAGDEREALAGPENVDFLAEAQSLLDWLLENQCPGYAGFSGGHRHPIQHLDGRTGHPTDPDVVSTSYAVRALISNAELDDRYGDAARSAADFVVEDLRYRETDHGAVVNYHMNHDDDVFTINAGALAARLLLDLYDRFGDDEHLTRARRILDHVAALQRPVGGWSYRDPPDSSHLSMDSHHNGFIVESFQRYAEVADDDRYADTLADAMTFYRSLFDADGAPDFDEESPYPRDIHASTQGILVFTYAGDLAAARRLVDWVVDNLYAGDGRYYFRKQRFYTQRITLMRWCQAWMAYALSEYLRVATLGHSRQVAYTPSP